jgi:iron complex transport system permease protein
MIEKRTETATLPRRLLLVCLLLGGGLAAAFWLGLSQGSSGGFRETWAVLSGAAGPDSVDAAIIWRIRFPRVVLAAVVGATLALGGLVFQALLRNPLAEPYILGVSGGSAIGAIVAMLLGLSPFPGVTVAAFGGSMLTLLLLFGLAAGRLTANRDYLLLGGVMLNAFCGAVIMFLISLSLSSEVRHILFWLMGDLSMFTAAQLPLLLAVLPSFILIFILARPLNLLLLGRESAASLGVNVRLVSNLLLVATTFMISVVVSHAGLIGFVGLVIPHILRLLLGVEHRLLVPASILGGAAYLILCDLLARTLPLSGELPVGIITALIGAPLFILLLWKGRR